MITLRDVHKSFYKQELFDSVTLQINAGDRYALVGPNGSGKSTLFKMLLGEMEPDGGDILVKKNVVCGYLPQENAPLASTCVLDGALELHPAPDGRTTAKAKSILMGLGFKEGEFAKPINELSGGWSMRVAIARLLMQEPDMLLLDEPTNHLDLESLLWLQEYLQSYPGAIFMISHDRDFINNVCASIVSVQEHTLKIYHGNYEEFVQQREAEKTQMIKAYKEQQDEIADMKDFIARNRVRHSTARRAQSMIKRLDRLERLAVPAEEKTVKMRFPQPARTGVRSLQLKNLHKSYGDVKVYNGLDFELERGWRMAFVGRNGAGKSTLLKILAGEIPFDAGERALGMGVKVGYFSQHRAGQFESNRTVLTEALDNGRMNPELMVRTVLGTFLFPGDTVFKKVSVLSGGEKSRLALVKLLLDPPNVLLMDEPTTHLDMASVDALLGALREFEGTMCFISHDVYFINQLATHIVHIDGGRITVYPGNYEYFERRRQQDAESPAASAPADAERQKPASAKAERRRQRAQDRDKERAIRQLETAIEAGHARMEKLAGELGNPEIYEDYAKAQKIGEDIQALQEELRSKETELRRLT
ncbi:MAG: ABC-F family ATP-binding cassette domain-containing protein [Elusimicrobiota bacterium]